MKAILDSDAAYGGETDWAIEQDLRHLYGFERSNRRHMLNRWVLSLTTRQCRNPLRVGTRLRRSGRAMLRWMLRRLKPLKLTIDVTQLG